MCERKASYFIKIVYFCISLLGTFNLPRSKMINIGKTISNGRVICGNDLCKREVGKLRHDYLHVLLFSYRECRLIHTVSRDENDGNGSIVINQLVEMDDYPNVDLGNNVRQPTLNVTENMENALLLSNSEMFLPTMEVEMIETQAEAIIPSVAETSTSEAFGFDDNFFYRMVDSIVQNECGGDDFLERLASDNNETSFYEVDDQILLSL